MRVGGFVSAVTVASSAFLGGSFPVFCDLCHDAFPNAYIACHDLTFEYWQLHNVGELRRHFCLHFRLFKDSLFVSLSLHVIVVPCNCGGLLEISVWFRGCRFSL
jgi:hypothetical protein